METGQFKRSSPIDENPSTSSDPATESEDQEVSDDDDRNHKHRRREAEPHSIAADADEQAIRRPNRKRKPFESRQMFLSNESTSLEGNTHSKFEKRRSVLTTVSRIPPDIGSRARVNQSFRPELGPRFDGAVTGRPLAGRGRGKNAGFWNQQEPRLSPLDPLDFSSQLPSQGPPAHPSLFVGGFPSAANTQTASWGAYGFMHPMGMQGGLQPTISPLLNMGVPRQRCRDFEERGFCLRGDMCPMEHGVNRIVVEDVQSLSQFNLPVSIPNSQGAGQAGSGSLRSGISAISKSIPLGDGQCATDNALNLDGGSSATGAAEADVYDPDQPLWNNECPEASGDLELPIPNDDDEWTTDPSGQVGTLMLSDGFETDQHKRTLSNSIGTQSSNSSVWGRIRHGKKLDTVRKANSNVPTSSQLDNDVEEHAEDGIPNLGSAAQVKHGAGKEMDTKTSAIHPLTRSMSDAGRSGRITKKASRTLYIQGIPQTSNRKEALLSHFHKFGNVVDIYIPLNSEIAFVQFSKREEAEAALKAPDAVMGNRFIKLWWANRDRIPVEDEGSAYSKFPQPSGTLVPPLSQPSLSHTEQGNASSVSNTRLPTTGPSVQVTVSPKALTTNGPTTPRTVQKKVDSLELLEELRKKQELLAKKRDEFRRQLDKYEKQKNTSVKKVEVASELSNKKHKGVLTKAVIPRPTKSSMTVGNQEDESSGKETSGEVILSPASNGSSASLQNDPEKDEKYQKELILNSSKLDCPPTSFIIVPPIPAGFADVSVMRDHFMEYDDLVSIVFEEQEPTTDDKMVEAKVDSSACVSFTTPDSAERAYTKGRCWEGQSLHFLWKTVSPSSSNYGHESEIISHPDYISEVKAVDSGVTITRNGETMMDVGITNCASIPKVLPRASCSSPNSTSCEDLPPVSDASG